MFHDEALSKNFIRGLAFWDSYIKLNNKTRLQDINIISEQFCSQLLNALYGWELRNANADSRQMPGFDLICQKNKIIVQVTSQCRTEKVKDCLQKLNDLVERRASLARRLHDLEARNHPDKHEMDRLRSELRSLPDLQDYQLKILFLTTDASNVRRSAERIAERPAGISFEPQSGIMDFATLSRFVQENCLHGNNRERLEYFIDSFPDLFSPNIPHRDHVWEVIEEYAQNYQSALFFHTDQNSSVTLQNLYVEPAYRNLGQFGSASRDIPVLLCNFLWQCQENDNERMLFIEGDAAIGKTSLVSWLCYHYTLVAGGVKDEIGEAIFLNRKIVCIRLRELKLTQSSSARTAILDYLNIDSIQEFKRHYGNAILILDGMDELSMVSGSTIRSLEVFLLELQRTFREHKFIITTRPQFLDLSMEEFHRSAFRVRRVELLHYNRNMRVEWLENYKKCGERISPATEEYITSLSDDLAEGVADTPLALYLLVKCDIRDELRGNIWALYHEIFATAITDGRYNANFEENDNLMTPRKVQTNYRVVQNIAYRMFQNAKEDRYYLNTDEIDDVISMSDLDGLTKEQVRSTCVLCAYWKNTTTLGALEFYHNNIRDFFLCEYISEALIRCIREHRRGGMTDALIAEFCRMFCWGDICGTTWEQAFTFLQLRLWYEKDHPGPDTLYQHLRRVEDLPNVIWHLSVSKELWSHMSPDIPYVSAKRVFTNSMMLMRILMDTEDEPIRYCCNVDEAKVWAESGLFRDWYDISRKSLKLSRQQGIGICSKAFLPNIDWSGCQLGDVDFSRAELSCTNFGSANLRKSSFRYANISGCKFSGASIEAADFHGAVVRQVDFTGTDLNGIRFAEASIHGGVWTYAKLHGNQFEHSLIEDMNLVGHTLSGLHFSGSSLNDCSFSNCAFYPLRIDRKSEFRNVAFADARISGQITDSRFLQCQFRKVRFDSSCRISAEFHESDFAKSICEGNINDSVFYNCKFDGCNFTNARHLQNVVFVGCSFVGAIFQGVRLNNVTFDNADLSNAILTYAFLDHCTFTGESTNLNNTAFMAAKNWDSNFCDVNFYGAKLHNSIGFQNCKQIEP